MPAMYFQAVWHDSDGPVSGCALAIALDGDGVGARITELTGAARNVAAPTGRRLRLSTPLMAHGGPAAHRRIDDYLWADGSLNARRVQRDLLAILEQGRLHVFEPRTIVAAGLDLVGRADLLARLEATLGRTSVHLRAPRRYGKTSVLRRLAERLPHVLRLDLSEETTPAGFVRSILDEAQRQPAAADALRQSPRWFSWPRADEPVEVRNAARERLLRDERGREAVLASNLLGALADAGVVLLADEFSVYVRNLVRFDSQAARPILGAFAAVRRRQHRPLRCVVAGSAGLSAYVAFHGLQNELADLEPIEVGSLASDVARDLVEELLYGQNLRPSPEAVDQFISHIGPPIPYFLHALAIEVGDHVAARRRLERDRDVDVVEVDVAYRDRLLGMNGGEYFKPFRVQDRPYPDVLRKAANLILPFLARSNTPVDREELAVLLRGSSAAAAEPDLDTLLTCLEEDFDLGREGDAWRIRCKVLADRFRTHWGQ